MGEHVSWANVITIWGKCSKQHICLNIFDLHFKFVPGTSKPWLHFMPLKGSSRTVLTEETTVACYVCGTIHFYLAFCDTVLPTHPNPPLVTYSSLVRTSCHHFLKHGLHPHCYVLNKKHSYVWALYPQRRQLKDKAVLSPCFILKTHCLIVVGHKRRGLETPALTPFVTGCATVMWLFYGRKQTCMYHARICEPRLLSIISTLITNYRRCWPCCLC